MSLVKRNDSLFMTFARVVRKRQARLRTPTLTGLRLLGLAGGLLLLFSAEPVKADCLPSGSRTFNVNVSYFDVRQDKKTIDISFSCKEGELCAKALAPDGYENDRQSFAVINLWLWEDTYKLSILPPTSLISHEMGKMLLDNEDEEGVTLALHHVGMIKKDGSAAWKHYRTSTFNPVHDQGNGWQELPVTFFGYWELNFHC